MNQSNLSVRMPSTIERRNIREFLEQYNLTLKKDKAFETIKRRLTDFVLYVGGLDTFWVSKPRKGKLQEEKMNALAFLRSYIYSTSSIVPSDNFLNTFDNFSIGENIEIFQKSHDFLTSSRTPRLLWIQGPAGSGKSHLLYATLAQQIYAHTLKQRLTPNTYHQADLYYDAKREVGNGNIIIIDYKNNSGIDNESNGKKSNELHSFNPNYSRIHLLDNVCNNRTSEVLDGLTRMYEQHTGQVMVTSNLTLDDWVEQNAHAQSAARIIDRLKPFIQEYSITPSQNRF